MTLDPTTPIGKLRLRVADYSDIPLLPDSVYVSVLQEKNNNLPQSAIVLSMYILGMLSHKTHRKMAQLEVWGKEGFDSYKEFLLLTVKDPAFMNVSPIAYNAFGTEPNPLIQFATNWNLNYQQGTQSDQLAYDALGGGLTSTPGRIDL